MISEELQNHLRSKYNPEGSTLRKAQLRMVDMLKYFDGVCRDNHLQYWLDFGTLLGGIRHGGFIPWDDDLDIVMKRSDAMKLRRILKKKTDECDFVLQCNDTDAFYFRFWDKIRDTKSANVAPSYIQDRLKYRGLAMDIFIMDDNINDFLKQKCTSIYHYLLLLPLFTEKKNWKKLRPLASLFYWMMRFTVLPTVRFVSRFRENNYLTYSYGLPWTKKFPCDIVFPLKEITFEGYKFYAPFNCDEYLKIHYGDWQKLPSEENIRTHGTQLELYF